MYEIGLFNPPAVPSLDCKKAAKQQCMYTSIICTLPKFSFGDLVHVYRHI